MTSQVADLSPAVAVMVTVPSATADTVPLFTVAIVSSELDQVTAAPDASEGVITGVSLPVSPAAMDIVAGSSDISVTGITLVVTITSQVADLPPALAVMVALPSFMAVTFPLSTVATDWSELDHVTVLLDALDGLTVAVRLAVSPATRLNVVGLTDTSETSTTTTSGSWGPQLAKTPAIIANIKAIDLILREMWEANIVDIVIVLLSIILLCIVNITKKTILISFVLPAE